MTRRQENRPLVSLLVFGGGGTGLMGAAAKGVHKGGGHIMGVIPKFFKEEGIESIFEHCDQLILPDTMRERKQIRETRGRFYCLQKRDQ